MPRKKKPESTDLVAPDRDKLVHQRKPRGPYVRTMGTTRAAFLEAYEKYGGNVSAACAAVGIKRQTYYRWRDSTTAVNQKFQKRLKLIRPIEKVVDAAELSLMNAIHKGDVPATLFTLKTQGKNRGWTEKPLEDPLIDKVAAAYRDWLADNPEASLEEKRVWLGRFAAGGRVEVSQLARKVGVE